MRLTAVAPLLPIRGPGVAVAPLLVFTLAVLLLAGIVHVATILLIPSYAVADGWSRLAAAAGQTRFAEIRADASDQEAIPGLDPLFVHGACRLDLSDTPAALSFSAGERFWSLALYDPAGTVVFSLNDRTSTEGALDMLVVDPAENAELRENPSRGNDQTIVVESPSDDLVALVRLYAPTANSRTEAKRIVAAAGCAPAPRTSRHDTRREPR